MLLDLGRLTIDPSVIPVRMHTLNFKAVEILWDNLSYRSRGPVDKDSSLPESGGPSEPYHLHRVPSRTEPQLLIIMTSSVMHLGMAFPSSLLPAS